MHDERLLALVGRSLREGCRVRATLADTCGPAIAAAAAQLIECMRAGGKVLLFGNGGSAADAQHISAELVGRFVLERRPLPAIALTVDTSALTAIGNDYGFDAIFARQVLALGQPGDLAVAITTSGRSPNVVQAVTAARARGMRVLGLTGARGMEFAATCDAAVVVPSTNTARIQECHIAVGHVLCEALDAVLFGQSEENTAAVAASPRVSTSAKELDLATLLALRDVWRRAGLGVVWTNGVFDVFHAGHLALLRAARAHGDVLVVGVNSDETVRRAKGEGRPVYPAAERVELVAGLEVVDHVLVFDEPTPAEVLSQLKPDVHCKGADYAPPNGAPMPEARIVRAYGGRIEFLPLVPGRSSTGVLARLRGED